MRGMDKHTGKPLEGFAHLKQSITDILTTPIGSRVMRRDYGSNLFSLIDAPLNSQTLLSIYVATAEALIKWEPRIKVKKVNATSANESGDLKISLEGEYLPDGQTITIDGIII